MSKKINIEDLKNELKQKESELEKYVLNNDYLSEEAEKKRKEIYKLQDKIELLEKSRDKDVEREKNIEEAIKTCKSYINAIDTFGTIDYRCINNLYGPIKIVLAELERLKE